MRQIQKSRSVAEGSNETPQDANRPKTEFKVGLRNCNAVEGPADLGASSGIEHPKMKLLREHLSARRLLKLINLDTEDSQVEEVEDLLNAPCEIDNAPQLRSCIDMLHIGDGPPDKLLETFHALEHSDVASRKIQRNLKLLRDGRSRALMAGYYSFLGRFNDADSAFQESSRYMEHETSVKIKFHRLLGMERRARNKNG